MGHDVIKDRYGRLYHLPLELSLLGHNVYCSCLSYRNSEILHEIHSTATSHPSLLTWHSENSAFLCNRIPIYLYKLTNIIRKMQPDVIIGSSDILHTILTRFLAKKTNTPYFIDLYDNYASFGMSKLPGMISGYRKSLAESNGIFTVSDTLRDHILGITSKNPVWTIESTITAGCFRPISKSESRRKLNLPMNRPLIGTAGSLSRNRGTEHLYDAFFQMKKRHPDVCLVLAGPVADNPPPDHQDIFYLGKLPHSAIPVVFNALDVAVICMKNDKFGRYAFPQKAYEILACKTPLVCARVGSLENLLFRYPECLYAPDDARDLTERLIEQLEKKIAPDVSIPSWADQARKIEKLIAKRLQSSST